MLPGPDTPPPTFLPLPPPGSLSLKPMGEMSPVPNQMPPKCVIAKRQTAGLSEAGVYNQTQLPVMALMGFLSPDGHPFGQLTSG